MHYSNTYSTFKKHNKRENMKTKLNTKLIALFIAFLLCFVVLLSPFAVFKADAETLETEEPQQNITTSTVQRVFDFSFCKEAMGLNEASAKKQAEKEPVVPDYDFYRYETNNAYFYVADLIEERSGLICLAIESRPNGNILHLSFYDEEEDAFTYYYESVDESIANTIKSIAIDSDLIETDKYSAIFESTMWYKHVLDSQIPQKHSTFSTLQDSKEKLKQYYTKKAQQDKNSLLNRTCTELQYNSTSKQDCVELFSTVLSQDDPIVDIIPREYFTSPGTNIGNNGSLGYYIITYEFPDGSNRFISDVLVWSQFYTTPTFESDAATLETIPELSGSYDYSKDGLSETFTPKDTVQFLNDFSSFALKNINTELTIVPINSTFENGLFIDRDEYFYEIIGETNGIIAPKDANITGFISIALSVASLVINPSIATVGLGALSIAFSVADSIITYDNGLKSSFEAKNQFSHMNFVADRNRHYVVNGNKFARQVSGKTAPEIYFGPNNHNDFRNLNASSSFTGYLNTEGTDLSATNKIIIQNTVDVVYANTYWFFGTHMSETYYATYTTTQECTYSRL